jgi:hypothetical protein
LGVVSFVGMYSREKSIEVTMNEIMNSLMPISFNRRRRRRKCEGK